MGILLFLILFLILVLLVFPSIQRGRKGNEQSIEIKGLDGTVVLLSEDGVSIFKEGEFRFWRKEEIKELSFKKETDNTYILKLRTSNSYYEIPVRKEELSKLFVRGEGYPELSIPWLPVVLGTASSLILAEILSSEISQFSHSHESDNKLDTTKLPLFEKRGILQPPLRGCRVVYHPLPSQRASKSLLPL
jgi:hypothetical protein